jgi:hemerythrin-like metal-binding protein
MPDSSEMYTSTGFSPVDDEHEALSQALAAFVEKVNAGKVDDVRRSLDGVIRGVAGHFAHEEEWMALHAYAQRKRHAEAHAVFLADMRKFQAEFEKTGVTPEFRRWAVRRLPDWFRYHILAHDMGLSQFLVKVGALPEVEVAVS